MSRSVTGGSTLPNLFQSLYYTEEARTILQFHMSWGWGGSTLLNLFDQIWSLGQNLDGTIFAMTGSPNNKQVSVERSARMMPIIFQLFLVNLVLFMAWV